MADEAKEDLGMADKAQRETLCYVSQKKACVMKMKPKGGLCVADEDRRRLDNGR